MRKLYVALSLFVSGCGTIGEDISGGDQDAVTRPRTIEFFNNDAIPVHLFGPGETFPCCRVDGHAARTITLNLRHNETAVIQAGRDGAFLATKQCTCTTSCPKGNTDVFPVPTLHVDWNRTGAHELACNGW